MEFIHLHHDSLKAIGEIGLDYSPHFMVGEAEKQVQQLIFKKLILVALQYQLPINVHSRNAGHYALECIQRTYMESGVTTQLFVIMHAFDGSLKYVRKVLKDPNILFYFSIPPCIVRLESFQNLVKVVPLERLLLESDSPALGPVKGIDNHPENISISCTEIAKIKQVSFEQVALQTNLNAQRIINVNIVNKDIIS